MMNNDLQFRIKELESNDTNTDYNNIDIETEIDKSNTIRNA